MGKKKAERIILLILLPVFAVGLIFRFAGKVGQSPPTAPAAISPVEQKEEYTKAAVEILEDIKSKLKKIKYEADSSLDPLKDKLSVFIKSIASVAPQERISAEAVNPPQLSITGLVWNTDRPQAIINGSVVSVGDEIEGARLLSVSRGGINIEYKGVKFFIKK